MKKFKKVLVVTLMLGLLLMPSTKAFASYDKAKNITNEEIQSIYKNGSSTVQNTIERKSQSDNGEIEGSPVTLTLTKKNGESETFSMSQRAFQNVQNYVYNEYQRKQVTSQVQDLSTDTLSLKADLDRAGTTLDGLKDVLSWIMGMAAFIAIMAMGLFTSTDILYMTVPLFREKVNNHAEAGGMLGARPAKGGGSKPRWVTDDALYAVQVCDLNSGKTPFGVYLKRRCIAWVLVAIVIYMLLTGNITLIVDLALKVVSGFLDVIASLG